MLVEGKSVGLSLEENAVDCIEDGKDDNRNCEIDEPAGRELDAGNVQREDDLLQKREDDSVDDEEEEPEGQYDEREAQNLEDGADERVEEAEHHAAYEIELPASGGHYVGNEIGDEEEDERVRGYRKEQFHSGEVNGRKSPCGDFIRIFRKRYSRKRDSAYTAGNRFPKYRTMLRKKTLAAFGLALAVSLASAPSALAEEEGGYRPSLPAAADRAERVDVAA